MKNYFVGARARFDLGQWFCFGLILSAVSGCHWSKYQVKGLEDKSYLINLDVLTFLCVKTYWKGVLCSGSVTSVVGVFDGCVLSAVCVPLSLYFWKMFFERI